MFVSSSVILALATSALAAYQSNDSDCAKKLPGYGLEDPSTFLNKPCSSPVPTGYQSNGYPGPSQSPAPTGVYPPPQSSPC
eukprot:jgi/Hompol1/1523/HPOL_002731-RA